VNVADRGRNIAKEALRLMLDHCFRQLDLERVYANTLPTNHASRRVLQENGFREVGRVSLEPHGLHLRYVRERRSADV
jgi:[ribosomal protein S5]-alanine N-acetyltransferase